MPAKKLISWPVARSIEFFKREVLFNVEASDQTHSLFRRTGHLTSTVVNWVVDFRAEARKPALHSFGAQVRIDIVTADRGMDRS